MGSDPAPFFAILFLYYYERKWLLKLQRMNLLKARKFCNTFRFIDDLIVMNDDGEFEKHMGETYPPKMILTKESTSASFLDLDISIKDGNFLLKPFDKADTFPFSVLRMPVQIINMPSSFFYLTSEAEILRIAKATYQILFSHHVKTSYQDVNIRCQIN